MKIDVEENFKKILIDFWICYWKNNSYKINEVKHIYNLWNMQGRQTYSMFALNTICCFLTKIPKTAKFMNTLSSQKACLKLIIAIAARLRII